MDTQRVRLFSSELVHLPHSAEKPNPLLESNQDMLMSSKRRQEKKYQKGITSLQSQPWGNGKTATSRALDIQDRPPGSMH